MKKFLFAIAALAFLASCGGNSTEPQVPVTDTTAVVVDSTASDSVAADTTVKVEMLKK